jgi:hypothetical protein
MFKLKWHGNLPENILEIEQVVRQDLVVLHNNLMQKPSKLIFHHVSLGDHGYEGPLVFIWGEDGDDDNYHCEYDPAPVWQSHTAEEIEEEHNATKEQHDN